jgi:hypothetical protein
MENDALQRPKDLLPLPSLLHRLGLGEKAKKSSRCPFHDDHRNSFSIFIGEGGRWFWKCHAGCGHGDEPAFLAKYKKIPIGDAIRLFKEMAGVNPPRSKPGPAPPPDWGACVEAFTNKHLEQLADWRGYSGELCSWLKQNDLVGLHKGCVAFPVHDGAGKVVAIHYRLADRTWRYYPDGAKVRPLIIGELIAGDPVHIFESQWDALAFMDVSGERSGIVITRGAGNGALVGAMLPEGSTAYLWTQNDEPDPKTGIKPGEKWQTDIRANTKATAKRVRIPAPHGDLNDWTRAGATTDDLLAAMMSAEVIGKIIVRIEEPAEAEPESEERLPDFPAECLPPILQREARAISELCGVPLAMSAPMVLAVASASIGKGLRVLSLPGRKTKANLYVLVCKTSGSGGSSTFKHATAPFVGRQKTERREFEEKKKPRIDAERAAILAQIEGLKSKARRGQSDDQLVQELAELNEKLAQIEKRVSPLLYVTDVTPEKLAEMLQENDETLTHFDSDAADALGIITGTRYGDGKHTQESLWLKSYTGEPTVIFRTNKNSKPIQLVAPCLSVLFVATPDKVQELFRNPRLTSGGLLPRFLVCDPRARPMPLAMSTDGNVRHTLPTDVSQQYEAANFGALSNYRFAPADPYEIGMITDARYLLVEDWNRFCKKNNGTQDFPFEARHTENAIHIALVLHTFTHVDIEQGDTEGEFHAIMQAHNHSVDEATTRNALQIRDWFNSHQDALRTPQRAAADDDAWRKAKGMLADRSAAMGITARDFFRTYRTCGNAEEATRLLEKWTSEARLEKFTRKPPGGIGRPTTAYRLGPLGRQRF